jgi:hypothetical protein
MTCNIPAIILEGIHYATGADRDQLRDGLSELMTSLQENGAQISRSVSSLMAARGSDDEKFANAADMGGSLVPVAIKSRLFGALGLAVIGGLVWNLGAGLIGTLVALCCFVIAGVLVLSVIAAGFERLKQQWDAFNAAV